MYTGAIITQILKVEGEIPDIPTGIVLIELDSTKPVIGMLSVVPNPPLPDIPTAIAGEYIPPPIPDVPTGIILTEI